ncbi:MAG: hypothetical protein U0975_08600 [Erythrobacter sp.]|nr:hypothetical protein [Erythrobacter sp.]MDZ4272716.1 hypothetical protein [Erythrobacter sp.]
MAEENQSESGALGIVARVAVGLGLAAIGALAARNRRAKLDRRPGSRSLNEVLRQRQNPRRKPPESGLPVPAIPPSGPLPMQGGATAPLEFDS